MKIQQGRPRRPYPFSGERNVRQYAATKGALLIFTKGLAKQLAKNGIRVNAVAPSPVWTPLQVTGGQDPGKSEELRRHDAAGGRAGGRARLALCRSGLKRSDRAGVWCGQRARRSLSLDDAPIDLQLFGFRASSGKAEERS
ncbi:SDR family oxidoreductase [Bradyrhizobium sp. LHD-71]|uniref:SDR family oxidoreductase n=1 Tax=Bradyrhizobium sp. LHD-71 TaxID=3072141 RepID=UPI0035BE5956